ncbi:MAG: hypothetical protein GY722_06225 [bacterium]|nr:hypothetical protein [bacterium]
MNLIPITLEGRGAWLLSIIALVCGFVGIGILLRHGAENLGAMTSARLVYPFAVLSARLTGSFWGVPAFLLFLQYLIYALILTIGGVADRFRQTLLILGAVHFTAALLCFVFA